MIDEARQAVIVVVEGFAMGGGFGMACLGDITIAHADAQFAMTEVTLGIVPAQISPFVVRADRPDRGAADSACRAGASTERQARDIGIAHEVAADAAALEAMIDATDRAGAEMRAGRGRRHQGADASRRAGRRVDGRTARSGRREFCRRSPQRRRARGHDGLRREAQARMERRLGEDELPARASAIRIY